MTTATLCYCAALRAATRKTTAMYDEALAPAGIGLAQFSLLRKIERGGRLSLSELARLAEDGRAVLRNGAPLWDAAQRRIETALGDGGAETLRALLAAL